MTDHIPNSWDTPEGSNAGGGEGFDNNKQKVPYIKAGTEVDVYFYHCEDGTKKCGSVPDAKVWKIQLICETATESTLVFCDIYKDARVWRNQASNGQYWVQNKFKSLCTGVSLRKSKEDTTIQREWFLNPKLFMDKKCRATVETETWNDNIRNVIHWFGIPTPEQEAYNLRVKQEEPKPLSSVAMDSNSSVDTFTDDIPF